MIHKPWLAQYDPGVPEHLEYPKVPLIHFLDEGARLCPERVCLRFEGLSYTYAQITELVERVVQGLLRLGIHPGERVGIFLPNCPEFLIAYFAIQKAGGTVVATNPLYTPPEIIHQANDAGIKTIFTSAKLYERIKIAQAQTGIKRVIVSGSREVQPGDIKFDDLTSGLEHLAENITLPEVSSEAVALMQYTGGTTGIAKAAVALHRNLVANVLQFKAWMTTLEEEEEVFLLALPVYHIYGMVCGMLLGLRLRATLVMIPDPRDITNLISTIEAQRVTFFPAAPTLYNAINNHPDVAAGKVDLTTIKACISGSAALMEQTKEKFESLTGGRIVEGYGLSEAPTATHCNPVRGENRLGSIGLPLPDVEARIISLTDGISELQPGETGELVIRSPQVMRGYHQMPGETAIALRNGWLYTGDIARMDTEGYFYIVDRKKDLIKPGGMEVWPREVEEVIAMHPKVSEVAVAGIPDEYRGETVKAWVVLKSGETMEGSEIQAWCRERLAPFKVPTQVELRDQFPKTAVGKILKRKLLTE